MYIMHKQRWEGGGRPWLTGKRNLSLKKRPSTPHDRVLFIINNKLNSNELIFEYLQTYSGQSNCVERKDYFPVSY